MRLACTTRISAFLLPVVATLLLGFSGCDSSEPRELIPTQRSWDQAFILSAVPMKKVESADGYSFEPMCRSADESPDGLLFNVLLKGTLPRGDKEDRDQSILPGDGWGWSAIDETNVTPEMFNLNIECIEPTRTVWMGCSTEYHLDSSYPEDVSFFRYGQSDEKGRGSTVALAIVIDMSGSMNGFVRPYPPYYEDSLTSVQNALPPGYNATLNATDPNWARLGAVESLINNLNPDDPVIVFTYNEDSLDVVCSPAGDTGRKLNCLSTDRSRILGDQFSTTSPLKALQGDERGRSPLWTVVEDVYSFMKVSPTAQNAGFQHILVIDDGPDTCSPGADLNDCTGPCEKYNTDYATVRALIEQDAFADRIPVHFVQMAARGYKERDAKQVELACLTGGHYTFVNVNEIVKTDLKEAMEVTLRRIGYTFRGYWQLAVPLQTFQKGIEAEEGHVHHIAGRGAVLPGEEDLLTSTESKFSFSVGDQDISNLGTVDRSLSIRKECNPPDDNCTPDVVAEGSCFTTTYWCDSDSLTCKSAQEWLDNGSVGGCAMIPAFIRISGDTGAGAVQYDEVDLGDVPTLCCGGLCLPPKRPLPPDEVVHPDDAASAVFFYDTEDWILVDPDDPEAGWVAYASFRNISASVTLEDIKSHLKYEKVSELSWENSDWSCSDQGNCFPAVE